jgi:hypothetical protein
MVCLFVCVRCLRWIPSFKQRPKPVYSIQYRPFRSVKLLLFLFLLLVKNKKTYKALKQLGACWHFSNVLDRSSHKAVAMVAMGYSTPLRVNFRHPSQFSETAKSDGFRKTHVVGIPKFRELLQSELRNLNDIPTFWAVLVGYSTRFGPILGTWANFREPLNLMVFVKLMLLAFRNVKKCCNRSYGI